MNQIVFTAALHPRGHKTPKMLQDILFYDPRFGNPNQFPHIHSPVPQTVVFGIAKTSRSKSNLNSINRSTLGIVPTVFTVRQRREILKKKMKT